MPKHLPNDLSSDPDAVMSGSGPARRPLVPLAEPTAGDNPDNDGPPLSPLNPDSMHRTEQDALVQATSPEFHDRPDGATKEPPRRPVR